MTQSSKIKILLVDDHIVMRMGLKSAISREPNMEVVAEAENGIEAIQAYEKYQPDVVVMDLRMPKLNGMQTIQKLQDTHKKVKILVYSSFASGEEIYSAFKAGATGFVVKDMALERLFDAIRIVSKSGHYLPPEVSRKIGFAAAANLTPRELEVLSCIARGMSNKEAAVDLNLAEGTVKIHLSKVLNKLGVGDRTQAVLTAVKRGIIEIGME